MLHHPRRLLWKFAFGASVLLVTMLIGNQFCSPEHSVRLRMLGHDFLPFYSTGALIRDGHLQQMYDMPRLALYERELARTFDLEVGPTGAGFGPWWNPPFYGLLFVPFAKFDYVTARAAWWVLQIVATLLALEMIARWVAQRDRDPATWGLVAALGLCCFPMVQALTHGQNTGTSLLIVAGTITLWRLDRPALAGVVLGLLFYKPQLAMGLALLLVLTKGRRALLGLGITGATLMAANAIFLPGTLYDWLTQMPANLHVYQNLSEYMWERHVTLKAFFRLLLHGKEPATATWLATSLALLAAAPLAVLAWRALREQWRRGHRLDDLLSAALVTLPLIMPFYFDYDLLLLVAAEALHAASRLGGPTLRGDGRIVALLLALAVWLPLNADTGARLHLNLAVPLLYATALSLLARATGRQPVLASDAHHPPVETQTLGLSALNAAR